jgi:transcriptional regulator with XRE-family HTH domain
MNVHPVDRHVGARFRQLRIERGLSQGAVAERVGLTFQQVQKYERGANRISASKLYEIAGVLGVPIAAFFEGLGQNMDAQDSPLLPDLSALDHKIMILVKRIRNEEIKGNIRGLLQAIAEDAEPAQRPAYGLASGG